MRVLGLDPGLQKTGWALVEATGNGPLYRGSGLILTDERYDLTARLGHLSDSVLAIVEEFSPGTAAIEETLANRNPGTTIKLAQARGALLVGLHRSGATPSYHWPNDVKKAVAGDGHARKTDMERAVQRVLSITGELLSLDEVDACAIALCRLRQLGLWSPARSDR